jgi:hypothetical protein
VYHEDKLYGQAKKVVKELINKSESVMPILKKIPRISSQIINSISVKENNNACWTKPMLSTNNLDLLILLVKRVLR